VTYVINEPCIGIKDVSCTAVCPVDDARLTFGHGAPLRLRNEIELGFKQVKWIKGIEFVAHYSEVGGGYGGYNQDHEFFGYRQSI
jgi:sulfoxide reductase catalytic subunit YedY